MRTALAVLAIIIASPAAAAPLRCEPIPQGAAGGRFLEEVTKVLRDGAFEHVLTGTSRCVSDWGFTISRPKPLDTLIIGE